MKILHFVPGIDRTSGGTSIYLQQLAKELGKLSELHVATYRSKEPVTLEHTKIHFLTHSYLNLRGLHWEWNSLLQQVHPDVVHVNCCWMPACALVQRWSQEQGYPVALTPHGMLEPWILHRHYLTKKLPALWLYQGRAIRSADCIHATAESEKANLLKLGYNKKVTVIPNGIDVEEIAMKSDWTRKKTILFLSRIHVKKGIELLLAAFAGIKEKLQGYSLVVAGEGEPEYIAHLKELANKLGIGGQIKFPGGVYGESKWKLYRNADVFVLPTFSENFGLVVAESLASGTPVITTTGTPWQELETSHCGWWVTPDINALKEGLISFLHTSEGDLEQMGRNGRKLIEEKYSSKRMAQDLLKLYRNILARRTNEIS